MLTALNIKSGEKAIASKSIKSDGIFVCPFCQSEVILKQGSIKIAHFAHKPPSSCEYGSGESELHRRCKEEIYTSLQFIPWLNCELEKPIGVVRPDIYMESKSGRKIAIEVQLSSLSLDRISFRTEQYNRLGVYVLWLPVLNESKLANRPYRYSPSAWEKWLHTLYFGKVYYWNGGLNVKPIHFNEHNHWVEESSWHTASGEACTAGGYQRVSKRYKSPSYGKDLTITDDFTTTERDSFNGKDVFIPRAKLLISKYDKWWQSPAKSQERYNQLLVTITL